MANKRQAKKLVIELSNQVISDCFNYLQLHPEKDNSDVLEIIDEVQQLRDELVMRMNHISGSDNPKLVKDYFRTIYKELFTKVDEAFCRLKQSDYCKIVYGLEKGSFFHYHLKFKHLPIEGK